ncbi:lipase family protein [Mycobacterium sp. D16R24]|uniref:lipase family protein n=1 Tax=Mycobacterium sp. D16R24 TaxID=1855656 RepID=UPI00257062C9|nr:lipase family protein [Mycobacterium sp. D16R24]
MRKHSGKFASGLVPPLLAAMTRAHPSTFEFLGGYLTQRGRQIIAKATEVSLAESVLRWPFENFDALVDRPIEELMKAPEIARVTEEMELGHRVPNAPVYLYHAIHEQLLPIAASDQLARAYIAGGTHVTYRRDRSTEHIRLAVLGGSDALGWLAAQ